MKNLKGIANLAAVRSFKPRVLDVSEQKNLSKGLKHFLLQPKKLHLEYKFNQSEYLSVL
jgi:hypothetical protein